MPYGYAICREMPVEKDIIYIKLAKSPLGIKGNAKHSTDGDGIYHGTGILLKVNARMLVKAFINKESFIPCNKTIKILFDTKHQFVALYSSPVTGGPQPKYHSG